MTETLEEKFDTLVKMMCIADETTQEEISDAERRNSKNERIA